MDENSCSKRQDCTPPPLYSDDLFSQFVYRGNPCSWKSKQVAKKDFSQMRKMENKMEEQALNNHQQPSEVTVQAKRSTKPVKRIRKAVKERVRKTPRRRTTLSAAEKFVEAYRRKSSDDTWNPPPSEVLLLQHDHAYDPWRVLIICVLLNRTTGNQARAVIPQLLTLCPNAKAVADVSIEHIEDTIRSLGLWRTRARTIKRLSEMYLQESWSHVTQLPGVGKYGADAHAIFCTGYWKQVIPKDHMLNYYWDFLHSIKDTL